MEANGALSFDALQMRLHPAASRIKRLSSETPATVILFDALAINGNTLLQAPLVDRRKALESFYRKNAERAAAQAVALHPRRGHSLRLAEGERRRNRRRRR